MSKEAAKKGLIVTQHIYCLDGAIGEQLMPRTLLQTLQVSAAWKEEQFLKALHEKKWMGLEGTEATYAAHVHDACN